MKGDPCAVCSKTELKLIDGFYYCIECGTQNTNVRETVVEQTAFGDGTFALTTKRKIVKLHDSKIQMSEEWYKWHAYNFIILGLADELVAAGAKPSFKMKLLWIWTRYVKKYQNKEALGFAKKTQDGNNENITFASFMIEENSKSNPEPNELGNGEATKKTSNKNVIMEGSKRDITFISRSLIMAMLYLALNLDEDDIQLSHFKRFMKEKHLNFNNLQRFVPEDIDVKNIQGWINFLYSKTCNMHQVRALALSLLRKLDLGPPKVPDLRRIVNNFMTELCLPNDLKPLVYSLMHFHRCDNLDMNNKSKELLVRLPDYEGVVMTCILVAIKMCFGLDGDYEARLSNTVEKINEDRNLSKSHRIGKYSEPSTRLFSFREWCSYMQFRKIKLCKCCLNMAEQHCLDIDDYVYMEHMGEQQQNNKELQDVTAMDLINKIPEDNEGRVIPKELFLPTLTPMSEYTDIIIEHSQDSEIKLLLSEDFTQYSLKYACEYLDLVDTNAENIIKGVSEEKKTISEFILGTIVTKKSKSEMVYVKNCENRNWMKTNPPTMEHVTCEDHQNESEDKESDHGYHSENQTNEKEVTNDTENVIDDKDHTSDTDQNIKENNKQVIITEEHNEKNIFDDLFEELNFKDEMEQNNNDDLDVNDEVSQLQNKVSDNDDRASISDASDTGFDIMPFNPDTFDREQTIKELILHACKKYKITVPAEYKTREPRKRKTKMFGDEAGPSARKKRTKTERGESKKKIEELVSNYYDHLQSDFLNSMQQEVSLAIQNTQFYNVTQSDTVNLENQPNSVLSDAAVRSFICTENGETQTNVNPPNNVLEQSDKNTDITLDETDDIDENLESKLFEEDEEMKLDDLIPKGDPKFDEEKYDVNQLYMKVKVEEEDIYDLQDLKLEQIFSENIEECSNNTALVELTENPVKTTYETDSEDEIPLSILQDERKMIEEMIAREENFDPLINKESISEFKYWIRHYDQDFMTRSMDWHKKFDEELKENTPTSFYFVIRECASVLNCTTFYLYKEMQNFERYLVAMAKSPD